MLAARPLSDSLLDPVSAELECMAETASESWTTSAAVAGLVRGGGGASTRRVDEAELSLITLSTELPAAVPEAAADTAVDVVMTELEGMAELAGRVTEIPETDEAEIG